jgi:ankyrin repeat/IBR domain-containing protein 1
VAHGADVFAETMDGLTAYDLAVRDNHYDIALFLESKMVFSATPDDMRSSEATLSASNSAGRSSFEATEEQDCGLLRAQDLQEAKDQVIVDTADVLNLPLFSAESLLRTNEWSREVVLENWMRDPVETCSRAGVQPPLLALPVAAGKNILLDIKTPRPPGLQKE